MTTIAVLDNINVLPETQKEISVLVGRAVVFTDDMHPTEMQMIERTGDSEVVLVSPRGKITANYLDACPSVKYVGLCGTSTANIDLDELAKRGITFTNVVDYGDEPTAEFIFMQLATLARGMGDYQWKDMPSELMGKTIGIIGLGALGKAIVLLALAYRMRVLYFTTHRKPEWEELGLEYVKTQQLVSESDIVVLSSPTNVKVLDKDDFGQMKQGLILVQASMGDIFDKPAFLEWIEHEGNFAIFDYAAGEQNYQSYKDLPRVIFPKIVAGYTHETKKRLGHKAVENIKNYLEQSNHRGQ